METTWCGAELSSGPGSHLVCNRPPHGPQEEHQFGVRVAGIDYLTAEARRSYAEDDVSVDYTSDEPPERITLSDWWRRTDRADLDAFLPKLEEYGARDLVAHGQAIQAMRGGPPNSPDRVLGEIGCMFYLHGKLARAMEAYIHGNLPSEDTLKDIETYARMARAFRTRGALA